MPSVSDRYAQGFQLGQNILGQRRQRTMEEERLGMSRDYLSIAQKKLEMLMNQPPESPYGKPPFWWGGAEPEQKETYVDKLTRLTDPQLSQMQQWLAGNPGKTVEDYLMMTEGVKAKFKSPTVPRWLTEETKTLFKGKGTRETETRSYEKKFQSAWAKVLENRDYLPEDKRKFWNSWRINVPKDLRYRLGVKLGLTVKEPTKVAPVEMPKKNQRQTYNECRDAGGTHEECLRQSGVTINR